MTQANASTKESVVIGHTGLTLSAGCSGHAQSFVYVNQNSNDLGISAPDWTVTGSSQLAAAADAHVLHGSTATLDPVVSGASLIAISQPDLPGSFELLLDDNSTPGGDDWYVDFVVTRNSHVFSVHAALHVDGTSCSTRLVATPAG